MTIFFPTQPVSGNHVVTSPTCTQSGGTLSGSLSCSYSSTSQLVTLTNLLTTQASGTFNFTMSGITNPISLSPVTGIAIRTLGSAGGVIDTGTGSWSVPTELTITSATWSLSGSTTVSTLTGMRYLFRLSVPVEANPTIQFTFPTEVTTNASLSSYSGSGIFTSGSTFNSLTSSALTVPGTTASVSAETLSFITFTSIGTPNKIKTTGSMTIKLYTSTGFLIASVSSGVTLASTALTSGAVNLSTVSATTTVVQTSGVSYKFTFNPTSPLINSGGQTPKIVVAFPNTITLASTCTFSGVSGALSASLTCTATNSGIDGSYALTNPFGTNSYTTSGTNLEITLGFVTNPNIVGTAGTFTVSTYITESAVDYLVDTGTFTGVTITAGTLTSPSVSASSTVSYASSVTYTITFTTQHSVVANGIIDINFPSTVSITDSSAAVAGCKASLNSVTLSAVACTFVSSSQIKVTSLFSVSGSGTVRVEIPGIRNPRTMGSTSSFTVTTTDNSGNVIDTLSSGFTVTMLSVSDLQAVTITNTATDRVNGVFDTYKVIVTAQTPTAAGDKMVLRFPTTMSFPASSSSLSCTAGTNISTMTCSMSSSTMTITATISAFTSGSVSTGSQFDFTISTLGNPISLAPASMQSINLVDSSDNTVNTFTTASSVIIQNTKAASIVTASLSQDTVIAGATAVYTFKFTPINAIPQHAKIELIYPSSVTVPTTITCTGLSGIPSGTTLDCSTSHNTAARTLTILNGFNTTTSVTTEVSFQISGIKNPSSTTTSSFSLSTLTSADFKIDTITSGLVPELECNYPCKTCSTSNKDQCQSCYTAAETGLPFLQGTTCQSACDTGYTPNGGTTCVLCDSSCKTCSTTSTTECTSCNTSGSFPFFYSVTSKCYATCPSGSYLDSTSCQTCISPCATCSSASVCESCISTTSTPYLLTNGTCAAN